MVRCFIAIDIEKRAVLDKIIGVRVSNNGVSLAKEKAFLRRWNRLCSMLRRPDYDKQYDRHLDFMWRYYIPIRHTFLASPLRTILHLRPHKLLRLVGFGEPKCDK